MKKFSSFINTGIAMVGISVLAGCVSAPGEYPTVAGIDDIALTEATQGALKRMQNEQKFKIAIVPERAEYTNSYVKKYGINKVIGDQVESLCSGLSMFDIVARQELDILSAEESLKNLSSVNTEVKLPKAVDGLLVYAITSCNIDAKNFTDYEYVGSGNSRRRVEKKIKKYGGYVNLKITLLSTKTQEKLFTKNVSGRSEWDEGGEHSKLLTDAVDVALSDFIKQFAYDFAPIGFVTQTTGEGRWARISLGTNSGLRFKSKVEFIKKDSNGQMRTFAYGEVREPNYDYSWVLVKNHDTAQVRNNAMVKVAANQSRSFSEKFADVFSLHYGIEE